MQDVYFSSYSSSQSLDPPAHLLMTAHPQHRSVYPWNHPSAPPSSLYSPNNASLINPPPLHRPTAAIVQLQFHCEFMTITSSGSLVVSVVRNGEAQMLPQAPPLSQSCNPTSLDQSAPLPGIAPQT